MELDNLPGAFAHQADNVEEWTARADREAAEDGEVAPAEVGYRLPLGDALVVDGDHIAMEEAANAMADAGMGDGSPVTTGHQVAAEGIAVRTAEEVLAADDANAAHADDYRGTNG